MKKSNSETKQGMGCLTLLGLLFFLVGVTIFSLGLCSVYQSWLARNWVPVEAQIIKLNLNTSRNKKSTNYRVTGQFSYKIDAQSYISDQIDFGSGSDNIGDYHQRFYKDLKNKYTLQKTVTAYVNPGNPNQAVINRDIRWEMLGFEALFLLLFGGFGLGLMYVAYNSKKKLRLANHLRKKHPEEPWRWKQEWQGNEFKSNAKSGFWAIAIFALFWNAISFPISVMIMPELFQKNDWKLFLVLIFPLIGLGFIIGATIYYLRWKKFGNAKLVLEQIPLRIGEQNQGYVKIPADISANKNILIHLICQRKITSGTGKHRRMSTETIWEDHQTVNPQWSKGESKLHFKANIPDNLPESKDLNFRNRIEWQLKVEKQLDGSDLYLEFDLPAFQTTPHDDSSVDFSKVSWQG